jgi:NADH:ubiquinone oxidoreductase subunit 5 (subunit L)/multisubunit Na+/H+ antiporter MnhA subunit
MYFLIYNSLLQSFFLLFFGRFLSKKHLFFFIVFNFVISITCSFFVFYNCLLLGETVIINCFDWFDVFLFNVKWSFIYNPLSCVMFIVVLLVSFNSHLYSFEYMEEDPFITLFISYLSLFTFFMLLLVSSDSLIQLFIGWEGVGLCSYLLINYWSTRILANKAAMTAVIANRVGDIFFMNAIILLFSMYKTTEIELISLLINF